MAKWRFIILVLLWLPQAGYSQLYVSPKKVTTGITVAIEINDGKDLDFIKANLKRFYGVQRVRINGDLDIAQVAPVLELLDDLQDVQLVNFKGDFNDEVMLKLEWVDNLTFYLKNGQEDGILLNNNLGKCNNLTLVFEVVPDDYFFMEGFKNLKGLTLIAPFVKKEAEKAVAEAMKLKKLKKFGISLDRIDDLPPAVAQMNGLEKITVVDNLSWILEKYTENIPVLRKNIEFIGPGNKIKNLLFEYYSQDAELYIWDVNHIKNVWPGSRFAALLNEKGDSTDLSSFADFVPLKKPKKPAFEKNSYASLYSPLTDGEYYFTGSTDNNEIFYLGNEAAILLPKNCLKSNTDSAYSGAYAVKCIWMNSPGELFTHGIGLNFDSSKRQYEISPSGLFYISIAHDQSALALKEGNFIKLVFRGRGDSADRFYAWNVAKNKWENYYDYDYAFDDSKLVATDFYSFYGNKPTARETYGMDQSPLYRRFETEGYFYLLKPGEQRVSIESFNGLWVAPVYNRAPNAEAYTLKRGKGLIGLKKEFVDKKTESGLVKFRIYDKTETLFPELKPFSEYVFEISTPMDPKEFSTLFIKNAVYSDVRIEQVGGQYEMLLRTDEGVWHLHIYTPAEKYKGQPGKAKSGQNDFNKRYLKYQNLLVQKDNALKAYFAQQHQKNMVESRNQMFYAKWYKLPESNEFKIRSTGYFVWGKPVQQPDTFNLIIKFTDAGGIPINIQKAWIAHKKPFSYRSFGALESYACVINPAQLQYIACQDDKGKIYVLNGTDFRLRNISNNSFIYLAMNELPKSLKNQRELEKILEITK